MKWFSILNGHSNLPNQCYHNVKCTYRFPCIALGAAIYVWLTFQFCFWKWKKKVGLSSRFPPPIKTKELSSSGQNSCWPPCELVNEWFIWMPPSNLTGAILGIPDKTIIMLFVWSSSLFSSFHRVKRGIHGCTWQHYCPDRPVNLLSIVIRTGNTDVASRHSSSTSNGLWRKLNLCIMKRNSVLIENDSLEWISTHSINTCRHCCCL